MAVSRTGKRGTHTTQRTYGRNGRVRRNAVISRCVGTIGQPIITDHVSVGRGAPFAGRDVRPSNINDNLSPEVLRHGRYETLDTIYRPSVIEVETIPLVVNRSVTVIDDWIDSDIFHRREVQVIERVRELWRDIKRPRHPHFDPPDPEDLEDGYDAERAKNLLRRCRALVGRGRWYVFENVARWNEPTGIPGSRIANITAASVIAAQRIVRSVADEIDRSWIL